MKLQGRSFYFLWAHYRPDLTKEGVPDGYSDPCTAEPVLVRPPEFGLGLLRLKPKHSLKE